MLARALSYFRGAPPPPLDDIDDLELPDPEPPQAPAYLVEEAYELPRPVCLGLTDEERVRFLREAQAPPSSPILRDLMRPVTGTVDFLVLEPLRMIFGNAGFIVAGGLVIGAIAFLMAALLEFMMAPFT